jgi:hypothetical protein
VVEEVTPFRKNIHPADELGDLKVQLKELEGRKKELEDYLVEHPRDRRGERFKVSVAKHPNGHFYLSIPAIRLHFGDAMLNQFRVRSKPFNVVVPRPLKK